MYLVSYRRPLDCAKSFNRADSLYASLHPPLLQPTTAGRTATVHRRSLPAPQRSSLLHILRYSPRPRSSSSVAHPRRRTHVVTLSPLPPFPRSRSMQRRRHFHEQARKHVEGASLHHCNPLQLLDRSSPCHSAVYTDARQWQGVVLVVARLRQTSLSDLQYSASPHDTRIRKERGSGKEGRPLQRRKKSERDRDRETRPSRVLHFQTTRKRFYAKKAKLQVQVSRAQRQSEFQWGQTKGEGEKGNGRGGRERNERLREGGGGGRGVVGGGRDGRGKRGAER